MEQTLFNSGPKSLERICSMMVIDTILLQSGQKVEEKAQKRWLENEGICRRRRRKTSTTILTTDPDTDQVEFFTQTEYFKDLALVCRNHLKTHLSSSALDSLMNDILLKKTDQGLLFALASLCSDRLSCLPISMSDSHWIAPNVVLECILDLTNLASLTLQGLASNIMLHLISETCTRLQILDISYSSEVTDLGLLYLCGGSGLAGVSLDRFYRRPMKGCKYLRELIFNPQQSNGESSHQEVIMPRVVSFLLKQLKYLRVIDVESLAEGLEYYLHGSEGGYHPKLARIPPLKLAFFQGSSDRLTEDVLQICPSLQVFKLVVTSSADLARIGQLLQGHPKVVLDQVSLVFNGQYDFVELPPFLQSIGHRLNALKIDAQSSMDIISTQTLSELARCCPLLEVLEIINLRSSAQFEFAAHFRYLNQLKLRLSPEVHETGLLQLLAHCPDLEVLSLEFDSTASFFSDFYLDDLLNRNPLPRLESFLVTNANLTLISALRLLNSRPKLRTIGHILKWDVEPSELEMFGQIVNRAKSLKLLHQEAKFI